DAAVDGMDAEVDLGFNTLIAVVPSDECGAALQDDSAFGVEPRELDRVGASAGEDTFIELPVGVHDGGPSDRLGLRGCRAGRCWFGRRRIVATCFTEAAAHRHPARRAGPRFNRRGRIGLYGRASDRCPAHVAV